jgi:integrase/recombinase XerC/integrase/recombinase XerD
MEALAKRNTAQIAGREPLTVAALQEYVEAFLRQLSKKQSTKAAYRRMLRQFLAWLEETGRIEKLSAMSFIKEDIVAFKEAMEETLEAHTVSSYLTAVRRLFSFLQSQAIYPDVAKDVEGPQKPKGHRKEWLSPKQIRSLLEGIKRDSLEGLRDYALINLLARTGLRTIEAAGALAGDIQQKQGERVLWIQGKGRSSKDEFVLLTEEAFSPILDYFRARGPLPDKAPIFCSHSDRNRGEALTPRSISRICKERMIAIGLDDPKLTAHSLRHSAITLSILGGATLVQAQSMARHSDPRTTDKYFHNINRVTEAAERLIQF